MIDRDVINIWFPTFEFDPVDTQGKPKKQLSKFASTSLESVGKKETFSFSPPYKGREEKLWRLRDNGNFPRLSISC